MIKDKFRLAGKFKVRHVRKGVVIHEQEFDNLVVDQGIDHALNVAFNGAAQVNPWYMGVFEANYTPIASNTGTNFPGLATETTTAYDEAARPTYVEVASTAQSITNNASRAVFTFNATKTIYGAFLISAATKGAAGGTLFCAAQFTSPRSVVSTDELHIAYTVNGA